MRSAERRPFESQPIHAAVELEPHLEARARRGRSQELDLLRGVHDEFETGGGGRIELLAIENAFEKYRGCIDAGGAQGQAFIDPRHRKGICGFERPRDGNEPVAIGIGLDDGHDARLRRPLPHHIQIMTERAGIDRRADHRGHRKTPSAYDSGA